jgi:hypothetical protein
MTDAVATLVTGKTDKEYAKELRERVETAIKPILAIFDEAKDAGITINFAVGPDYRGKNAITALNISRLL